MTFLLAISLVGCNFGLTVENPADTGDLYGGDTRIDGNGPGGGPSGGNGGNGDDGGGSPGDGGDGDDGGSPGDGGGEDTDTTGEGGDDGGGPGGDTTGPPANNPPDVIWFEANDAANKIDFEFDVDDIDGDLTGGTITISVGSASESYTFPTEVQGSAGNYRISWDALDFERERSYSASIRAQDQAGHNSSALSDSFERGPWTSSVPESGDTRADGITSIGAIELPAEVSGNIYSSGASNAYGDQDWVKFQAPATGNMQVSLTWTDSSADYDLYLAEGGGAILESRTSTTFGESISYYLYEGEYYLFGVLAWEGGGSNWTVRIE